MNLFLVERATNELVWHARDTRTAHLKKIIKAKTGELVDFGVINGPRGKGRIEWMEDGSVKILVTWNNDHPSDLLPLFLIIGLARPQTCRKVIEQAAALGVSEIHFFEAEKGEPSYAKSSLWENEWKRLLIKGAEQAFACHLPVCIKHESLESALVRTSKAGRQKIALDPYETNQSLRPFQSNRDDAEICLAIGAERGWSSSERNLLRQNEFALRHLGERVLRVETAMVASVGLLAATYWSSIPGNGR